MLLDSMAAHNSDSKWNHAGVPPRWLRCIAVFFWVFRNWLLWRITWMGFPLALLVVRIDQLTLVPLCILLLLSFLVLACNSGGL